MTPPGMRTMKLRLNSSLTRTSACTGIPSHATRHSRQRGRRDTSLSDFALISGPRCGFVRAPVLSPFRSECEVCGNVLPGSPPSFAAGRCEVLVGRLQDRPDPRVARGDTVHQVHPSSTLG